MLRTNHHHLAVLAVIHHPLCVRSNDFPFVADWILQLDFMVQLGSPASVRSVMSSSSNQIPSLYQQAHHQSNALGAGFFLCINEPFYS